MTTLQVVSANGYLVFTTYVFAQVKHVSFLSGYFFFLISIEYCFGLFPSVLQLMDMMDMMDMMANKGKPIKKKEDLYINEV